MEGRNKTVKAFRQKLNPILMSKTMSTTYFQNIIESIESLPVDDQDYLFDLIRKKRIEKKRLEIIQNGEETIKGWKEGKAKEGNSQEIMAYLLEEEE